MLGRGGETNNHVGNVKFRQMVLRHKDIYLKASRQDKSNIAWEIVMEWRHLSPPGRFLTRTNPLEAASVWHDVGDEQAKRRTSKTLGEKTSKKRKVVPSQVVPSSSVSSAASSTSEDDDQSLPLPPLKKKARIVSVGSTSTAKTSLRSCLWKNAMATATTTSASDNNNNDGACSESGVVTESQTETSSVISSSDSSSDNESPTTVKKPQVKIDLSLTGMLLDPLQPGSIGGRTAIGAHIPTAAELTTCFENDVF